MKMHSPIWKWVNKGAMCNLKVSKFKNEFMKSSFLQQYEQKNVKISALTAQGRNPDNFLFVFC